MVTVDKLDIYNNFQIPFSPEKHTAYLEPWLWVRGYFLIMKEKWASYRKFYFYRLSSKTFTFDGYMKST